MDLTGKLATRSGAVTAGTITPAPCPDTHELLQWLLPVASFFLPKSSSGAGTKAGRVCVCLCVVWFTYGCVVDPTLWERVLVLTVCGQVDVWCFHSRYGHDSEVESQHMLFFQPLKAGRSSTQPEGQGTPSAGFPFYFH